MITDPTSSLRGISCDGLDEKSSQLAGLIRLRLANFMVKNVLWGSLSRTSNSFGFTCIIHLLWSNKFVLLPPEEFIKTCHSKKTFWVWMNNHRLASASSVIGVRGEDLCTTRTSPSPTTCNTQAEEGTRNCPEAGEIGVWPWLKGLEDHNCTPRWSSGVSQAVWRGQRVLMKELCR